MLGDDAVLDLVRTLRQDLVGAGPLEPLLQGPGTTDVIVNGPRACGSTVATGSSGRT